MKTTLIEENLKEAQKILEQFISTPNTIKNIEKAGQLLVKALKKRE